MQTREFRFEAEGSAFYLVVTVGSARGVILSLPDFQWSYSVSPHAAPTGAYLRSHGIKNKVDADSVGRWLAAHWRELVDNDAAQELPTVLVVVGEGASGKSLLGRLLRGRGATVLEDLNVAIDGVDKHTVVPALLPHGFVVVPTTEEPHPNVVEFWRKLGTVHVARLSPVPRSVASIGHAGRPMLDVDAGDDLVDRGRR